jgi:hypothetical protein
MRFGEDGKCRYREAAGVDRRLAASTLHWRERGKPLIGAQAESAKAHTDIPAVVEAMRQCWMPLRGRRLTTAYVAAHAGYKRLRQPTCAVFALPAMAL